jgi:hypothetical protein
LSPFDSRKALHEPDRADHFIRTFRHGLSSTRRLVDWSRNEENGVMWPFKAKRLDSVCLNGLTRKIFNGRAFALRHCFLRAWPLMGWKGVSD